MEMMEWRGGKELMCGEKYDNGEGGLWKGEKELRGESDDQVGMKNCLHYPSHLDWDHC